MIFNKKILKNFKFFHIFNITKENSFRRISKNARTSNLVRKIYRRNKYNYKF